MGEDTVEPPVRPWWVRLAIPVPTAKRRDVLRNVVVMGLLAVFLGGLTIARAFLGDATLYPYRWIILAGAVVISIGVFSEVLAIRWTDRAGLWTR